MADQRWGCARLVLRPAYAMALFAACTGACTGSIGEAGRPPTDDPTAPLCSGERVVTKKRLVRLTFNQTTSSIRALLGDALADQVASDFEIVDASHRTFPPLQNPREGALVNDTVFDIGDRMAQQVSKYVSDNFATVTKCATPTDACAQQFLRDFAGKAYRRPITADETSDVDKVYTDVKGFGGSIQEATQFGVYSVLESPGFLYRTELGTDATAMGALGPYELASALSYFLTDGPPDAPLLAAAGANMLASREQIQNQVDRILATDAARQNLHGAMMSYFAITALETIVIDSVKNPSWNDYVRSSMFHESELFLQSALWSGKLADLLTSTRSSVNETLAPIYGIAWPPAGAQLDADGFATVDLPSTRSGMLTQGGFLVARARPMAGSVVGRGLLVNKAFLCNVNPEFPTQLADTITAVNNMLAEATEREKADYRAANTPCSTCHPGFDPYGLALENFDTIAQYRTMDDKGRRIDPSVTLPELAGGAKVADAAAMGKALTAGTAFATCIAKNLMNFALSDVETGGVETNSCAAQAVVKRFAQTDGTFTSLMREIALSQTLSDRLPGGAQ
jgi:hypothetical protein